MKNLMVRSISGIIYVAVIVAAIAAGPNWFFLLTAVLTALGVFELQSLVGMRRGDILSVCVLAFDMAAAIVMAWMALDSVLMAVLVGPVLIVYMLLRGVAALYDRREHPFRNVAWSLFSVLYLGVPMATLNIIYCADPDNYRWLVLIVFMLIWLNDTGAFCIGTALGRHRMFPRLSPKKSLEGFAGGLVCCMAVAAVIGRWFDVVGLPLWQWLLIGVVVCVFATWGDLFESLLKRNVGVKDSGNIIPGHGGILDRIDSLLFVAPAMLVLLLII